MLVGIRHPGREESPYYEGRGPEHDDDVAAPIPDDGGAGSVSGSGKAATPSARARDEPGSDDG